MAGPKQFDRVKDTTTTTGTGTITLANSAPTGFRTFGSVLSDGDTVFYTIVFSGEWETGIGTYTASGTTLARTTVLASSNGGAAVNFSAGTKDVFCGPLAAALAYYNPTNTVANLAAYQAGRLLLPSNGFNLYRDSGSALAPWGPLFPFTAPVDGDFAWINQGSATVSTTNGGIVLSTPSDGATESWHIRKKAAPSTPYTITTAFLARLNFGQYAACGIGFRQSSDGKLSFLVFVFGSTGFALQVRNNNSPTSYSSSPFYSSDGIWAWGLMFFRIADNGTNRIYSYSANGQTWHDVYTVSRTTFLTADEVCFQVLGYSQVSTMTLLHWAEA